MAGIDFRKSLAIITSTISSVPFPLSFPSDIPIRHIFCYCLLVPGYSVLSFSLCSLFEFNFRSFN